MVGGKIHAGDASDPAWQKPVVSVLELSRLVGISRKTLYEWIARGRLDGAFRKRGKHILIVRERAMEKILNGKDWK